MNKFSLSEITIYPVKSFAGISLDAVQLDRFGPVGDRRWMLVDEAGIAITQRDQTRLALMKTQWGESGLGLRFGDDQIQVSIPAVQTIKRSVTVWDDHVAAVDAGDEVAQWLATRLELKCRLVYIPDDSVRTVDSNYATAGETVGFADAFQLHLQACSITSIPRQLLQVRPYLVTLLAVVSGIGKGFIPTALCVPFRRRR